MSVALRGSAVESVPVKPAAWRARAQNLLHGTSFARGAGAAEADRRHG